MMSSWTSDNCSNLTLQLSVPFIIGIQVVRRHAYVFRASSRQRDHFVNAPSQWETTVHCNVVSRWLDAYTKRSLQARYWRKSFTRALQSYYAFLLLKRGLLTNRNTPNQHIIYEMEKYLRPLKTMGCRYLCIPWFSLTVVEVSAWMGISYPIQTYVCDYSSMF